MEMTRRGLLGILAGAVPAAMVAVKGLPTVQAEEPYTPHPFAAPPEDFKPESSVTLGKLWRSRYAKLRVQLSDRGGHYVQFNNGALLNNHPDPVERKRIDDRLHMLAQGRPTLQEAGFPSPADYARKKTDPAYAPVETEPYLWLERI